jgi:ABC-type Zn uptake system ZnuABC Zn-binding protein ZnuA
MCSRADQRKAVQRLSLSIAAGLLVAGCLIGCSAPPPVWPKDAKGLKIMTSFPPIYCFVSNVAGEDATVRCLLTTNGPHEYQPTTKDALQLRGADLFFINGLDLDSDLAKRLAANSGNPKLKDHVIKLGESAALKDKLIAAADKDDHHHGHHHGNEDPHVWLGIPEGVAMTEAVRDALIQADPQHKSGYETRAAAYIDKLKKLETDGVKELADKKDRNLIAFHESLQYYARTFKLNVVGVIEPTAGAEPDPGRFKELVDLCKEKKVRVIAVEPQFPSNKAAKALLDEIRAKGVPDPAFVEVDPIETAPPDELGPDYYEKKMRANLANLAKVMK